MTYLFYVRLIGLTAGTLVYLFLLALILGHRRPRIFERLLFFFVVVVFLIYAGGLLAQITEIQYRLRAYATQNSLRRLSEHLESASCHPSVLGTLITHTSDKYRNDANPQWSWSVIVGLYVLSIADWERRWIDLVTWYSSCQLHHAGFGMLLSVVIVKQEISSD